MTLLHDAYTALLSGLTHRTGNRIHWYDEDGKPITVEPVDVDGYRVSYYRGESILCSETYNIKNQLHGQYVWWYPNGQKEWEAYYHQGQKHGRCVGHHPDGQKWIEEYFTNGQRHGKSTRWYKNESVCDKQYYISGRLVNKEEWEQYNESTT